MPRQPSDVNSKIVSMYTIDHLTCEEIGKIIGMSRVGIWKRLQRLGISSEAGERVQTACKRCGKSYELTRRRWRSFSKHYCSAACYAADLHNPAYHYHRQGMRLARKIVAKHMKLEPKYVVHHVDCNTDNNTINNLWAFSCQADHLRHHRGGYSVPIWKGSDVLLVQ